MLSSHQMEKGDVVDNRLEGEAEEAHAHLKETREHESSTPLVVFPPRPHVYGIEEPSNSESFNTDESQDITPNTQQGHTTKMPPNIIVDEAKATTDNQELIHSCNDSSSSNPIVGSEKQLSTAQPIHNREEIGQEESEKVLMDVPQLIEEKQDFAPFVCKNGDFNPNIEPENDSTHQHVEPNDTCQKREEEQVFGEPSNVEEAPSIGIPTIIPPEIPSEFAPINEVAAVLAEGNTIMKNILEQIRNIRKLSELNV